MYDEVRIKRYKLIGTIIGGIILVMLLLFVVVKIGEHKQPKQLANQQEKTEEKETITPASVKKFLIAYYTKKDLGENRNRYKPLVTPGMYNELVAEEKQPVNQAYKGYVVNQVLDRYKIYIDSENNEVISEVSYKNTQRVKINNDDGALKNQENKEAMKLTFVKQGSQYLVDKMEPVTLTNYLQKESNTYKETEDSKNETKEKNSDDQK
ncbi:TPA: hypothetical protein U2J83_002641 [Enterococcus faecalis]|nr:hypothetical protein [Enterococcus faecalis]